MRPDGEIIQLPLPNDPFQFVKREVYAEEIVDGVLDFLIDFIKAVLGERYEDEEDSEDFSQNEKYTKNPLLNGSPVMIILDTVYLMDEASWRLLELIKDECSRIAIVLLVQTDTNNNPKIH